MGGASSRRSKDFGWYSLQKELATCWRSQGGASEPLPVNVLRFDRSMGGLSRDDHVQAVWARLYGWCRGAPLTQEHHSKLLAQGAKLLLRRAQAHRRRTSARIRDEIEDARFGEHSRVRTQSRESVWPRRWRLLLRKSKSDPLVHTMVLCIRHQKINPRNDADLARFLGREIGDIRNAKKRLRRIVIWVKGQVPE